MNSTRVTRSQLVATIVQIFPGMAQIRQKTVAKYVMELLDVCGFITVDRDNKKGVKSALRLVQSYISFLRYNRGEKKVMHNNKLIEDNVRKCDEYVQFMMAVNQDPTRRVIYMDERYTHKNYQRHGDLMSGPNDEQYLEVKEMHKGRLFLFHF